MPRPLRILINLLAITLISFLGVDIFYRLTRPQLGPEQTQPVPPARRQAMEQTGRPASPGFETLIKRNLFGGAESSGKVPAAISLADINRLEPTTLQLRLLGTIAGDEGSGRAIIEDLKRRNQDLYRVGDEVQGARLKKVLRGKVVLETAGRDEILTMTEKRAEVQPSAKAAAGIKSRTAASSRRPQALAPAGGRLPAAAARPEVARLPRESGVSVMLEREDIQATLDNLGDILTQVRVQPVQAEGGNPGGLQVNEIRTDSIFSRMGLRDGDVVEAVNEKQIESPDDIITLYQSLKASSEVNLRISRGGQQQVLNYTIR